uniref:Uncharacterized protein n=1 Tax=Anguilla anguilla TaxID=7936 RepID=A0A0E9PF77_ANGAN
MAWICVTLFGIPQLSHGNLHRKTAML